MSELGIGNWELGTGNWELHPLLAFQGILRCDTIDIVGSQLHYSNPSPSLPF